MLQVVLKYRRVIDQPLDQVGVLLLVAGRWSKLVPVAGCLNEFAQYCSNNTCEISKD